MSLLEGKTCLLTGASGGLGLVIAEYLLSQGVRLALHTHRSSEGVCALMAKYPAEQTCLIQADLSQPAEASRLWQAALNWSPRLDGLINNAAVMLTAGVHHSKSQWSEAWQQTLQVNLLAAADLCYEAINHFQALSRKPAGGILITISSRAAHRGDGPEHAHYAASKAALIALNKTLARAYAQDNDYRVKAGR